MVEGRGGLDSSKSSLFTWAEGREGELDLSKTSLFKLVEGVKTFIFSSPNFLAIFNVVTSNNKELPQQFIILTFLLSYALKILNINRYE